MTDEPDDMLDVDLKQLVARLLKDERDEAAFAQDSVARLEAVPSRGPTDRIEAELESLFDTFESDAAHRARERRIRHARAQLVAIQRTLEILIGPPPPIQSPKVKEALAEMQEALRAMRRATAEFHEPDDEDLLSEAALERMKTRMTRSAEANDRFSRAAEAVRLALREALLSDLTDDT